MKPRIRLRTLFVGLTVVAVFVAYIVAYFNNLQPQVFAEESSGVVATGYREPRFRRHNDLFLKLFAPLIALDQCVRPNYWDNWCSLDDVRTTEDYSWGDVERVNGTFLIVSIYANNVDDVESALEFVSQMRTVNLIRVDGESFFDSDLRQLLQSQTFAFVSLMNTKVTKQAVDIVRLEYPNTGIRCIAANENGFELY